MLSNKLENDKDGTANEEELKKIKIGVWPIVIDTTLDQIISTRVIDLLRIRAYRLIN